MVLIPVYNMKGTTILVFLILPIIVSGKEDKVFHFLDYTNVSIENSGWLILNQNASEPLTLPEQYSLCVRVFKWYERLKYQSFGTINLLDDSGNITNEFTHSVSWSGRFIITEFFTRNYVLQWSPVLISRMR